MSYSSYQTKERILECAKIEFLSKGFSKANMRDIAKNAKVTTGAMYNHFKNKEMLFEAIVGETARELYLLYDTEHKKFETIKSFVEVSTEKAFEEETFKILDYVYDHFEQVKLLFCHSAETKYENFKDKLINIEESATLCMLNNQGVSLTESELFFVHVMASSGVNNMLEAVYHDLPKKQAILYLEKLQSFYYAGWKRILGR